MQDKTNNQRGFSQKRAKQNGNQLPRKNLSRTNTETNKQSIRPTPILMILMGISRKVPRRSPGSTSKRAGKNAAKIIPERIYSR